MTAAFQKTNCPTPTGAIRTDRGMAMIWNLLPVAYSHGSELPKEAGS